MHPRLPSAIWACAGGLGAVLSVFQRIGRLEISQYAPRWYAVFQGVARGGLGVFFGMFFVLVNRANLLLGTFMDNVYATLTFAALAGISERFIPEIIRKLENYATDHGPGTEPQGTQTT